MKLHFLGTTGYHPSNRRQTACLMLPEIGVILDAGTGLFRARDLLACSTLDIFLSHVHLDHCIGLTFLYDVLWERNVETVRVHVAADKRSAIEQHLYHPELFPVPPNFEFCPLQSSLELRPGLQLTTFPLEHPGGAHGFRLEGPGTSLAYVTDTVAHPDAPYVQELEGVETLIHECYFPDGWEERAQLTGHSCLTPTIQVAQRAGARRLYLVHINPLQDDAANLQLGSQPHDLELIAVPDDQDVIEV